MRGLWVSADVSRSAIIDEIVALAGDSGTPVRRVPKRELEAMSQTDSPQGVVARADPISDVELDDLVEGSSETPAMLVVLDGVTDPHNLGAVMRTALCAGASGVVIGRHRAAGLGPTAVKAAAGAVEHLRLATVPGIPAALARIAEAGIWVVGLDAGATRCIWDLDVVTEPVSLVLGAEGRGLSRLSAERCEVRASIPIAGPLDSLNVSAAAALACFEVARKRAQRP